MKRGFRFALLLGFLALGFWLPGQTAQTTTFVLMTENLEMPGGWMTESASGMNKGAKRYLIAPTPEVGKAPAVSAVEIPHAGKWRVWVRSRDFANNRPGVRYFTLRVGQATLERKFGTHGQEGQDGWAWEDGGQMTLSAGPLLLVLGEECRHSARCEAILFTDNMSYVPEGVTWELHKEAAKTVPVTLSDSSRQEFSAAPLTTVQEQASATLENETIRIRFHPAETAEGKAVDMKISTKNGDRWELLNEKDGDASYRVLSRPLNSLPDISRGRVYPTWDTRESPAVEVSSGGDKAKTRLGPGTIPWLAGKCLPLRPIGARQKDAHTVELTFAPTPAGRLYATWILEPSRSDALVRMSFKPTAPGHYSLGFHGPLAVAPDQADSWLLPFQFHKRRFPKDPVLQLNATTPTPMTLVNRGGVSCALVADPVLIPYEWQQGDRSRYGFGLRNEEGLAQPMVYSPVMGLQGSRSEGNEVTTRFRLWVQRGDWYAAYRSVADGLFGLKDYREPTTFSLTDTVFNLIDLMGNETASGWDAKAKGSVQIESRNVVTQSSPLVYLSLYLLTGDRHLYDQLARPSLEFLLSRPEAHFAIHKEIGDNYYRHQPMQGPVRLYGATTYASALAMTQGRSPAFGELALQSNGQLRRTAPNGHGQPFDDALMLYQTTGEKRWLDEAIQEANKYLEQRQKPSPLSDPGDRYFVNVSYTSNWEGLLHLYEASGEKRFLKAAEEGAQSLLSTLWTQPKLPAAATQVKLNPGGVYDHSRYIWWWEDGRKRIGIYDGPDAEGPIETEAPKIPERQVPAWTVSNIGLGLEHPFTYVRREGQANILMSVWAANLLRMSQATGDTAFRTAARNAMIGRFANYPGYYLDGQTDEFRRADYPVKGPDITSLYVHHIAPFAASVLDFLFTDAEMRSQGQIFFPAVRQMGYVWFDSRLWGHAPGTVYGQKAWPWLHRTAVTLDNPKVDHLLAQGNGKLHVILMNQALSEQRVKIKLDAPILGRSLDKATLTVRLNGAIQPDVLVQQGSAEVSLPVQALMVLSLADVKIDVPTQRTEAPKYVTIPAADHPALQRVKIGQSPWQALATTIQVPPFEWQDFYAYVNCGLDDLKTAVLRYRIGDGAEQTLEVKSFPFEFSVRLEDPQSVLKWSLEAQLPDGTWQKTEWH